MRKYSVLLLCGIAVISLAFAVTPAPAPNSYGEDRALIENLQARYMFAMDFRDADTYAGTFTKDGVLDYGAGELRGRDSIRNFIIESRNNAEDQAKKDTSGMYRATGRHNITNIVIKVDGNKAVGRAYWFHYGNDNPKRTPVLNSYGHYEDEMVKVNGEWLFSKRKIFNEQVAAWVAKAVNPAW